MKLLNKLGIDKAIGFTIFGRLFQALGGIISVLLVSTYLTGIEQGFYYTFASILAIQVFFELGLGTIITQFVAHEKIFLQEVDNELVGNSINRSRLSHLLHFCLRWYVFLSFAILVCVSAIGLIFFTSFYNSTEPVSWEYPWILLVIGTTLNFIIAPISSFIEGLGKVKEIAKIRMIQQIATQSIFWFALLSGFKLYAAAFSPFIGVFIFIFLGKQSFGKLLYNIYKTQIVEKVSYFSEIFPYQWRVALSWISGYLIFQLFNPVLFAYQGAIVAGQMGMTLNILNAIMSLSDSWFSTKVPIMSGLIAKKEYHKLDQIFILAIKQSLFIVTISLFGFLIILKILAYSQLKFNGDLLSNRFLNISVVVILGITIILRQIQSGLATYLRCHKKEPLMYVSIFMSIACLISIFIMAKYSGVYDVVICYAFLTFISTLAIYFIYQNKKKVWHNLF